jgi:hypothetical protein
MEFSYYQKEFIDKLISFVGGLVIKYQKLADDNETMESSRYSRRYIMAYQEMDQFTFYEYYSEDQLRAVGITDDNLIAACLTDINNVPIEYQPALLLIKRDYILSTYVEFNNYYRMLKGLPNYGETALTVSNDKAVTELTELELITYEIEIAPKSPISEFPGD